MSGYCDKSVDFYDYIDEGPPMVNIEEKEVSKKLDDVLKIVRSIDQRLKNQQPTPPIQHNEKVPIPAKDCFPFSIAMNNDRNRYGMNKPLPLPPQANPKCPPPRPPKDMTLIEPVVGENGSFSFTSTQCKQMIRQLMKVQLFLDDEFSEEHVDKEINVSCLASVIKTLNGKLK